MRFATQVYRQLGWKIFAETFPDRARRPWMKLREIEIIQEVLGNLKPQRCLEWGAGYSTLFFPSMLSKGAQWISMEHDFEWFGKIKNLNRSPNVHIEHVPADNLQWGAEHGDEQSLDFKTYIQFPRKFGKFDFILVDGMARCGCLVQALDLIGDKGLVVLHDANRNYYHEPLKLYKGQILFTDFRAGLGGLWIGGKSKDVDGTLNLDFHQKVWQLYNTAGKDKIGQLLRL